MNFFDLVFQRHANVPNGKGIHARHFFPNGYGISVVKFPGSYGYENGLYEAAVLQGSIDDYDLCYDTPITDDVLGDLTEEQIEVLLYKIENL